MKIKNQLKTKKLGKNQIYLIILLIVIIVNTVIIAYSTTVSSQKILAHAEIDTKFIIGKNPGLAVESEYIFFGMVTRNGGSKKKVLIHSIEEPVLVNIYTSEEIVNNVIVDKNDFILYPENESVNLTFSLTKINNLSYGNYTGKVFIDYYELGD